MVNTDKKTGWDRAEMAQKVALDIPDGSYVNLGIGIPEMVAGFVPEGREVIYQTENGLLGMGKVAEPGKEDREEIFHIHLRENNADPKNFDIHHLIHITQGWNAAEIQQLVQSARVEKGSSQSFNTDDIVSQSKDMIPLSHTMKEQIKAIKDWAWDRATPASYGSGAQEFSLDSDDETSFELPESI